MTGTGTQVDPYIVGTLADFIMAAGTSGAYVELQNDINVALDPVYKHGLSAPISISCADLDGNGHRIYSAKITAAAAVVMAAGTAVHDLQIVHCQHVKTALLRHTLEATDTTTISGCDFAFCTLDGDCGLIGKGIYTDCSMYFSVANAVGIGGDGYHELAIFHFTDGSTLCNIEVHGVTVPAGYNDGKQYPGRGLIWHGDHMSVVGDGQMAAANVYTSNKFARYCDYCLLAMDLRSTPTGKKANPDNSSDNTKTYLISDLLPAGMSATGLSMTTEQSHSMAYLMDIGLIT